MWVEEEVKGVGGRGGVGGGGWRRVLTGVMINICCLNWLISDRCLGQCLMHVCTDPSRLL